MADYPGAQKLGALFGGGGDFLIAEAEQEGRLRTAQTEKAMEEARTKRLERTSLEAQERELQGIEQSLADAGVKHAGLIARIMRMGRGNADQQMNALLGGQEFNLREGVADVATPPEQRHRNLQAIQGIPSADVDAIGTGMFTDLTAADQTPQLTALGTSMVGENEATEESTRQLGLLREDQRLHPERYKSANTAAVAPGGVKVPSKYMVNPNFDPMQPVSTENPPVIPIPGTDADPNFRKPMGVRERQVVARIVNAGLNTSADLSNIMRMPSGVDSGVLGTGVAAFPGISVLDATAGHLKYKLSDPEVRDFTRILGGLTNQMATLEGMGMAATESMRNAYSALALRPGDTIEDKMMALALIRQTTENGLQTISDVNPLPRDLQDSVNSMLQQLQQAVPFTPQDVIELKYGGDESKTLRGQAEAHAKAKGKDLKGATNTRAVQPDQDDTVGQEDVPLEQVLVESGFGKYNAQGQVVDSRGWIFMRSADGSPAWVKPDRTDFEPIAE